MSEPALTVSPVIPAENISSRSERFYCEPYKTGMMVLGCVQRQAIVRAGKKTIEWAKCIECPLGRQIEQQSGGPVAIKVGNTATGGWGHMDVEGAKKGGRIAAAIARNAPLPNCTSPGCTNKRAHVPASIPGADGLCPGHRVKLGKQLKREAAPAQEEPTLPTLGSSLPVVLASHEEEEAEETTTTTTTTAKEKPMAMTPEQKRIKQRQWQKNYYEKKKAEKLRAKGGAHSSNGVTITKPRGASRSKRAARGASRPSSSPALADQLSRALEAVELCDRVGWNVVRALAVALKEQRG